ncbi:MAG: metalloprotease TldD [bacterium]|nr:metalloprotease TldD [bacterium]
MKKEILDLFYKKGLPPLDQLKKILEGPLKSAGDFAEIYVENVVNKNYRLSERIVSGISASYVTGAGIRVVRGNKTGFSYTENLTLQNISKCIEDASRIAGSSQKSEIKTHQKTYNLYDVTSSINEPTEDKVALLKRAEAKAFSLSPQVEKFEAFIAEKYKQILVVNTLGTVACDRRPLVRIGVSAILKKGDQRESGSASAGGRVPFAWLEENPPEAMVEKAVKQAQVLLDAKPAPAGEMEVILGAGESGILLHESIGHPLEADFNFRGSSAFSGRIGEKVASDQCTIVDRGDLPLQRGSINIDDEGSNCGETVLIEKGILKSYMYDLITARHFKQPSCNGRRESFRDIPLPRMTNTLMLPGKYSEEEIVKSVNKGIYAKTFSGGQVDISSGDFVFSITEGYLVEDGKIGYSIKGATLIGNGPEILKRVQMVGKNMVISGGKWTCGKDGQDVPVGVGMPMVKLSHITVGGTQND